MTAGGRASSPGGVGHLVAWNLIPGSVCLVLGGFQWWLIVVFYLRIAVGSRDRLLRLKY
jgi:hypothetical protein